MLGSRESLPIFVEPVSGKAFPALALPCQQHISAVCPYDIQMALNRVRRKQGRALQDVDDGHAGRHEEVVQSLTTEKPLGVFRRARQDLAAMPEIGRAHV